MKFEIAGLRIDASRQSDDVLNYIPPLKKQALARAQSWIEGGRINDTEDRPAMHMALRAKNNGSFPASFVEPVLFERERQKNFVLNCTAKTVLHIGIGGSEFGPRLAYESLSLNAVQERDVRFVSTLTPETVKRIFDALNPQETLVVLTSKSFTTDETSYLLQVLFEAYSWPKANVIVVTAAYEKALEAGFADSHIFPFWDWVGGRYSLWSSVGLSIALAFGWTVFEALLAGAETVDKDLARDIENCVPFHMARFWNGQRALHHRPALAFLPYHDGLRDLPAYLQQLIMESNGKPSDGLPAPIVFGAPGTNFQHSFGQFLHQGPDLCLPVFIDVATTHQTEWQNAGQKRLHANAVAQADMLWSGDQGDAIYKTLKGGRPSLFITMPGLTPLSLGALLALFEHATVLDGFLSGVNPFDQWGVEAAKRTARDLLKNGA